MLDRLSETHGLPQVLVMDYGPEFTSKTLETWASAQRVRPHSITRGKPMSHKKPSGMRENHYSGMACIYVAFPPRC